MDQQNTDVGLIKNGQRLLLVTLTRFIELCVQEKLVVYTKLCEM